MNERIRELAEQAVNAVDNPFPGNPLNDELEKMYIPDCFAEKFAELIVRECVQTLIDKTPEWYTNEASEEDWDKGYDRAMKDCVHHIKEHFGVSND